MKKGNVLHCKEFSTYPSSPYSASRECTWLLNGCIGLKLSLLEGKRLEGTTMCGEDVNPVLGLVDNSGFFQHT